MTADLLAVLRALLAVLAVAGPGVTVEHLPRLVSDDGRVHVSCIEGTWAPDYVTIYCADGWEGP